MEWLTLNLIIESIALGVALAMDAFSVSLTNGLNEPNMRKSRMLLMAGTFCGFQIAMPLAGWICVHTIAEQFEQFSRLIPWIALILLLYIGGKMLIEGIRDGREGRPEGETDSGAGMAENEADSGADMPENAAGHDNNAQTAKTDNGANMAKTVGGTQTAVRTAAAVSVGTIMLQGIATSIDALSTGFTIADYGFAAAFTESVIIGVVTFIICIIGLLAGRRIGTKLSGKASILGGVILIIIGLKIFIEGVIL